MSEVLRAIQAEVASRTPVDERERVSIDRFLKQSGALDRPFAEDADPTHITGSAIVIGSRGVVLHRHRKLGLWLQPGGHIDPGEAPWEAALREGREETGLPMAHPRTGPRLVHVDVHPGPHDHTHLDLRYLLVAADEDPAPGPEESQDVRWFPWDRAIDIADPGLRGALIALHEGETGEAPPWG